MLLEAATVPIIAAKSLFLAPTEPLKSGPSLRLPFPPVYSTVVLYTKDVASGNRERQRKWIRTSAAQRHSPSERETTGGRRGPRQVCTQSRRRCTPGPALGCLVSRISGCSTGTAIPAGVTSELAASYADGSAPSVSTETIVVKAVPVLLTPTGAQDFVSDRPMGQGGYLLSENDICARTGDRKT